MPDWALWRAPERIAGLSRDIGDSSTLRAALLGEIRHHVGFDAYAWLLTDPETEVGSDPLADVPCLPELHDLIRLKYSTEVNRWTQLTVPLARLRAGTEGHPEKAAARRR